MPLVPCANPVNCIGVSSPTANLTAEAPDVAKCFRYAFTHDSSYVCEFDLSLCEAFSAVGSDVGVLCAPAVVIIDGDNPPPPVIYSSNAQSCTVDCGGFSETYDVAPGTFVALSQAQADADANAFACQLAAMQCTGPTPALFTNSAQSCTITCPDQTLYTFTIPAAFFTALSQAEANANAFIFACEVAALLCSGLPPVAIQDSAGVPPSEPLWGNFAQSCSATCPDGSTFTYTVPGGTYLRESRAAANAVAFSNACDQAQHRRVCLSDLEEFLCAGDFYGEFLDASGVGAPTAFAVVAGALPPGLTLDGEFLQGVPTSAGDYTFAIRATGSNGFAQRTYSQTVVEITPDTLPDGAVGAAYAAALTATGFNNPVFSVEGGSLPSGVSLQPFTGVLSGTPDTAGTFSFVIRVTES